MYCRCTIVLFCSNLKSNTKQECRNTVPSKFICITTCSVNSQRDDSKICFSLIERPKRNPNLMCKSIKRYVHKFFIQTQPTNGHALQHRLKHAYRAEIIIYRSLEIISTDKAGYWIKHLTSQKNTKKHT
jgi:hypothetical protein